VEPEYLWFAGFAAWRAMVEIVSRRFRRRRRRLPVEVAAADPVSTLGLAYCTVRIELERLRGRVAQLEAQKREAVRLGIQALQREAAAQLEAERLAGIAVDGPTIERLLEES
jgi:hypothetical protein